MELVRTERLLLRHWRESDLSAFFDLYPREDVTRWLGPHPRRPLATPQEARDRLRRWHAHEHGLPAPLGLKAGIDQALALTDLDNVASQRVAERLAMRDEGVTDRWFGLTTRQYRKVMAP